jgi:hypothetical protein
MDQALPPVAVPDAPGPEAVIRERGIQSGDGIRAAWTVYAETLGPSATEPCSNAARILLEDWGCATVEGMGSLLESEMLEVLCDQTVQRPKWLRAIQTNFRVHFRRSPDVPASAISTVYSSCSGTSAGSVKSEGSGKAPGGARSAKYDNSFVDDLQASGELHRVSLDRQKLKSLVTKKTGNPALHRACYLDTNVVGNYVADYMDSEWDYLGGSEIIIGHLAGQVYEVFQMGPFNGTWQHYLKEKFSRRRNSRDNKESKEEVEAVPSSRKAAAAAATAPATAPATATATTSNAPPPPHTLPPLIPPPQREEGEGEGDDDEVLELDVDDDEGGEDDDDYAMDVDTALATLSAPPRAAQYAIVPVAQAPTKPPPSLQARQPSAEQKRQVVREQKAAIDKLTEEFDENASPQNATAPPTLSFDQEQPRILDPPALQPRKGKAATTAKRKAAGSGGGRSKKPTGGAEAAAAPSTTAPPPAAPPAAPAPSPPARTFPAQGWLVPDDEGGRVMRMQPKEKSSYLDGDWGEETQLTEQFLIQPGETLNVLKEQNGFFNCEWKGVYGWLRSTTVAFADPSVEGALAIFPVPAPARHPHAHTASLPLSFGI